MTSNEVRSRSALKEYGISTGVGGLYGATNTVVGHPFDTVKTKMQAQSGFGGTMTSVIRQIWLSEGALHVTFVH